MKQIVGKINQGSDYEYSGRTACGAGMTLATGKSGRYRYYRCGTRIQKGDGCAAGNVPVEKLDTAVRLALCDRVFTEARVRRMLEALRGRWEARRGKSGERVRTLRAELERNHQGSRRLFEAVERGLLPLDATLTQRAHELKARRGALLLELAGLEREAQLPAELLAPGRAKAFCAALRVKMLDPRSEFGRRYLRLLVEEVRVEGRSVVMRGSHAAVAQAVGAGKLDSLGAVPRFGLGWLAIRHLEPKPNPLAVLSLDPTRPP